MKKILLLLFIFTAVFVTAQEQNTKKTNADNPPIYIAFLWHMHQPIYYPYKSVRETDGLGLYSYSVEDIHNQRIGPYTNWPKDAIQKGIDANLPHLGAQVSFSGSLIENLNGLESAGNGNFSNWKSHWQYIVNQTTSLGNPRVDMIGFGYHHPLMGLIEPEDIVRQINMHEETVKSNFNITNYSKGIFPPENAFRPEMIPALLEAGIEWALVDNVHFERAVENYPWIKEGGLVEPNKADVQNPNPDDWVQLQNLWAPTKVSALWSRQPKYVEYTDPETGQSYKMIAVPGDRYLGNEDGRGGFGALQYESVMSQLESYNTDPNHPMLIVLPHDGDNYGGGSSGYYGSNFQSFVNWLQGKSDRFVCTTIEDYLEMYPPDPNDVIHVENGSWSGADNGDPEFKKWLGDPGTDGYSYDRNSWGVLTAAANYVRTAEQIDPNGSNTQNAYKYLLNSQASDYWYWDGTEIWDSNPTRAANIAVNYSEQVLGGSFTDNTPPSIFIPQREPYNPGATEWGTVMTSNVEIWTYVYDVSDLQSVKLKYRTDNDDVNDPATDHNETYAGGADVTAWSEIAMSSEYITPRTDPMPTVKADKYFAEITDVNNKLVDYYVEATDTKGNVKKSPILHVWIGNYTPGGGGGNGGTQGVTWEPASPFFTDTITITVTGASQGAKLHWGVNGSGGTWETPIADYRPTGSVLFGGSGPAVETPFNGPDSGKLTLKIGPFTNENQSVDRIPFVIHYDNDSWDNNGGNDYQITVRDTSGSSDTGSVVDPYVIDGQLDQSAAMVMHNGVDDVSLYLDWTDPYLYIATESALSQGGDVFLFISGSDNSASSGAPWAKAGDVLSYDAYIANESTNNYNTWDKLGLSQASSSYLEGKINIDDLFTGGRPSYINIGVGVYNTSDNGTLMKQVPKGNDDGNIDAGEYYEFNYTVTDVENDNNFATGVPEEYGLEQNYPNPFNGWSVINYSMPQEGNVSIKVYDVLGREAAVLINKFMPAGNHIVKLNSDILSSGVYFYRIQTAGFTQTRKMILMK